MGDTYCRLCLSREKLLNIFNPELTNSEQLRMCILMCTGVNILSDDLVTKYVCHTCCEISIKLFKFRKNALANDKALKTLFHQKYVSPMTEINSAVNVNDFLMKNTGVKIRFGEELNRKLPTAKRTKRYAVHPSVIRLVKCYPNIKLPEEVLVQNCDPRVCAENLDVSQFERNKQETSSNTTTTDLDDLMQKYPGVSIVKLSETGVVADSVEQSETVSVAAEDRAQSITASRVESDEGIEIDVIGVGQVKEKEGQLKRKRIIEDKEEGGKEEEERKEVKKAKNVDQTIVDLKIPEPTSHQNPYHGPSENDIQPSVSNEQTTNEIPSTQDHGNSENFEVYMLTTQSEVQLRESLELNRAEELVSRNDELEEESDTPRKILRPRKSRPSFFADEAFNDDSDDDYVPEVYDNEDDDYDETSTANHILLKTFQVSFTCDICHKTFDNPTKLKLHKRMHKDCPVCKKTYMSQKALNIHLHETCYKRIIENPPVLCLRRCDEVTPTVTDEVLCISDDDDEPQQMPTNQQLAKPRRMGTEELQKITQVFQKYYSKYPPYHKAAICQENAQLYKIVMGKGQATMENMYPVLKYFRIPVILNVADIMQVELIDNVLDNSKKCPEKHDWFGHIIRNLSPYANPKTKGGRHIVPKPTISTQQQEIINASVTNTSGNLTLKDMLVDTGSADVLPKIRLPQNIPLTVPSPATTQPVILNTMLSIETIQSDSLQNATQATILKDSMTDQIATVHLHTQPTPLKTQNIANTQNQHVYSLVQPQYAIQQAQRPLPPIVPKTYTAKPCVQAVHQTVKSQNVIPQIHAMPSQPQTITVQQSTPAYIQNSNGYLLSTTHATITPVNENMVNNQNPMYTVTNSLSDRPPPAQPDQNSELQFQPLKVVINKRYQTILPNINPPNQAVQEQPIGEQQPRLEVTHNSTESNKESVDATAGTNPVDIENNKDSQNQEHPNSQKKTSGLTYIRVKAPWELSEI